MKLKGKNVIRILDRSEDVAFYWRYYMPVIVNGKKEDRSITVGRNGPIAQYMASIGSEDKRFRKPSKRLLLNVLDRADSRVKILDFGPAMLDQFTALHNRVRRRSDSTPIAIWDMDLEIISTEGKEPKDVKRMVLPGEDQEALASDLAALPKFDLSKANRIMPDDAQIRLLNDVDLLEILKDLNWERLTPTVPQNSEDLF